MKPAGPPGTVDTVLIVEDDATLLRGLKDNFEDAGYLVRTATDGLAAMTVLETIQPDLILLDIMMPKVNGYEVCRRIREKNSSVPIIMLTAKGQESDIVLGLNLGADDYVTKPFSIAELLARARAFLRRSHWQDRNVYRFGDSELDLPSHRLKRGGREIELTPKEFGLLSLLVRQSGRAFTRDEILAAVWGDDLLVTRRSVDRCVNTLRGKIEEDPSRPRFIRTVRDIGYRFEPPGEGEA